jgi:hypothetical protein
METAVPGLQAGHAALATALEYEPAAHDTQELTETYVPGPQGVAYDCRLREYGLSDVDWPIGIRVVIA